MKYYCLKQLISWFKENGEGGNSVNNVHSWVKSHCISYFFKWIFHRYWQIFSSSSDTDQYISSPICVYIGYSQIQFAYDWQLQLLTAVVSDQRIMHSENYESLQVRTQSLILMFSVWTLDHYHKQVFFSSFPSKRFRMTACEIKA